MATLIDHLVVAVDDLAAAVASFTGSFGFHRTHLAGGDVTGIVALSAGGVTVVLVGPEASPAVARYLEQHGGGIQHVAIEVLNAGYARASLADAEASLLTNVVVDDAGHEQFFAARDLASGVQLGFIAPHRPPGRCGGGERAAHVRRDLHPLTTPAPTPAAPTPAAPTPAASSGRISGRNAVMLLG